MTFLKFIQLTIIYIDENICPKKALHMHQIGDLLHILQNVG